MFNCHEPWIYQLRSLGYSLDIVVDLPGRYTRQWDWHMRPIPPLSRLISLDQALHNPHSYDCIIAHNITDLLDVKSLSGPRLLILHLSLQAHMIEEKATIDPWQLRDMLRRYLRSVGGHAVAVTQSKAASWE